MGLFSWLFGRTGSALRDEVEVHRGRGVAHLARGEYAPAAAVFREALGAPPDGPRFRRALAAVYRALGEEARCAREAARGLVSGRGGGERVGRWRGRGRPLVWEGEWVGHFTPGQADDYPRVKGAWTSSGSRQAGRFGTILLRPDYCTRRAYLRVSLGTGWAESSW